MSADDAGWGGGTFPAEPVPLFDHSRRVPLMVFACFADDAITHLADGKRGSSAGTGLSRLNMTNLEPLSRPVPFSEILANAPPRVKAHLSRVLDAGGVLPSKSLGAVVDILMKIESGLSARLARYSDERRRIIAGIKPKAKENLALQKEALVLSLKISGVDSEEVLAWSPSPDGTQSLLLEGIPEARVREDAMIVSDLSALPGFNAIKDYHFAAKTFQSTRNERQKVTVIMANKLPLELQTGADLIYYNEMFHSFILVQYKPMEKESEFVFRWQDRDQLAEEISRMDQILDELKRTPQDSTPSSFRLNENPFFLKICPRFTFNPDDKGLFSGMYLPLDYWKRISTDTATIGPKGGRQLTFENVGRHISNSDFISIVGGAWIGTTIPQSAVLSKVIRAVLETGKTVVFAVKRQAPSDPAGSAVLDLLPLDGQEQNEELQGGIAHSPEVIN
ncbi:hypothetical protein GAY33_21930 [Azospirillum brasilense]|uniref:hypothetical protein n=1 Tax=Azospirillum argentinense TaxID=2970906 RepID=UPI00190EF398|nr:hypothetical protein [Azospirillum argentinense]MBK3801837.1 hypothetical protein [Azospirillum argentinense]